MARGTPPRGVAGAVLATTLSEFAGNRRHLGGVPAFSLVLHTWKQDLGNEVALRVRADAESGKKRTLRMSGTEFIDRFLQHVPIVTACGAVQSDEVYPPNDTAH